MKKNAREPHLFPDKSKNFFQELQIEFLIHELKDPISVIETGIRALLEKRGKYGELSPRQEKTLKRVLRNTQKTRGMLYDLLEIGQSQAGCPNASCFRPATAVYEVLMDAMETMAEGLFEQCGKCQGKNETIRFLSGCGIFLDLSPSLLHTEIFQDEIRFRQILSNLIKNALHYRNGRIEIRMKKADGHLLTDVIDDGPGIDPKHHQIIFERYAQIKDNNCPTLQRKGHGLGLAGALVLAKHLGGGIELKSKKGKGAAFRLILPMSLENI